MTAKIIGALILIVIFYVFTKAATGMLGKEHALSKVFPIGSGVLVVFLLSLIFIE